MPHRAVYYFSFIKNNPVVTLAQDCLMASLSSVWVTALVTITSRRGDLPGAEHTDRGESRGLLPAEGFKMSDNEQKTDKNVWQERDS